MSEGLTRADVSIDIQVTFDRGDKYHFCNTTLPAFSGDVTPLPLGIKCSLGISLRVAL